MESFEEKQPAWQDISLNEIKVFIADEQIKKAINLARMRYEGIKSTPAEIDATIAASGGTISAEAWRKERDALLREITELESILHQYQQ